MHGGPYVHGRCAANKLARDDRLHGAEEEAEDPLVCDPLAGVLRVGDIHVGIVGAFLDGLCRGRYGAVEVVMKVGAGERRTEEDAERPTAVEALGIETIAPEGAASARAEVEDISRRRGGELAAAGGRSCGGSVEEPKALIPN
jgi:hypothetical protein